MTKGKNKKIKTTKIYLFLLPPLPSQEEFFFHRYMGIWTKSGKIDRMAILAKT